MRTRSPPLSPPPYLRKHVPRAIPALIHHQRQRGGGRAAAAHAAQRDGGSLHGVCGGGGGWRLAPRQRKGVGLCAKREKRVRA